MTLKMRVRVYFFFIYYKIYFIILCFISFPTLPTSVFLRMNNAQVLGINKQNQYGINNGKNAHFKSSAVYCRAVLIGAVMCSRLIKNSGGSSIKRYLQT